MSERTVYRDVADLQYQGVPIEGEAGVGYRLGAGFDLPPLIFTLQEAQALVVMTLVAWCEMRQDFRSFRLDRIHAVTQLPKTFPSVGGQRLIDYLREQGVDAQAVADGR